MVNKYFGRFLTYPKDRIPIKENLVDESEEVMERFTGWRSR